MNTEKLQAVNINGAVLTDELIEKITHIQKEGYASYYYNSLDSIKNIFIQYSDDINSLEFKDVMTILNDIVALQEFMQMFKIREGVL
ncbi:MAG: hypothetical protein LBJ63_11160 [Prevotellaceae bacterium]|jgi:hypothetical protein|nr:hypothetical protein [Prevotellaceae bacterium]